jgi:hypothetical protein
MYLYVLGFNKIRASTVKYILFLIQRGAGVWMAPKPAGTGTGGLLVADVPSGPSVTLPHFCYWSEF